jgi:hypothetical protein
MNVTTMMLCERAEIIDSKVNITGGGLCTMVTPTPEHDLVVVVDLPWDRADGPVTFVAELTDADGNGKGKAPLPRPPGRPSNWLPGAPVQGLMVLHVNESPLSPGRYTWKLWEGGNPIEGAYIGFTVE